MAWWLLGVLANQDHHKSWSKRQATITRLKRPPKLPKGLQRPKPRFNLFTVAHVMNPQSKYQLIEIQTLYHSFSPAWTVTKPSQDIFVACLFFAAITKIKICFDSQNGSVGNFFSREKGPRVKLLVEPGTQLRPREPEVRLVRNSATVSATVMAQCCLKMHRSIISQLRTLLVKECLNYLSKASNL